MPGRWYRAAVSSRHATHGWHWPSGCRPPASTTTTSAASESAAGALHVHVFCITSGACCLGVPGGRVVDCERCTGGGSSSVYASHSVASSRRRTGVWSSRRSSGGAIGPRCLCVRLAAMAAWSVCRSSAQLWSTVPCSSDRSGRSPYAEQLEGGWTRESGACGGWRSTVDRFRPLSRTPRPARLPSDQSGGRHRAAMQTAPLGQLDLWI